MKNNINIAIILLLLFVFKLIGIINLNEVYVFSFSVATFLLTLSSFINSINKNFLYKLFRNDIYKPIYYLADIIYFTGFFSFIALPIVILSMVDIFDFNNTLNEFNSYITIVSLSLILISIAVESKIISNRDLILEDRKELKKVKNENKENKEELERMEQLVEDAQKQSINTQKMLNDQQERIQRILNIINECKEEPEKLYNEIENIIKNEYT
ncbi:MAG: hypothetical protein FH761_17975 [Firmicutes bacterium]|nr:hypothetical protein [Bacillota bacterium]